MCEEEWPETNGRTGRRCYTLVSVRATRSPRGSVPPPPAPPNEGSTCTTRAVKRRERERRERGREVERKGGREGEREK